MTDHFNLRFSPASIFFISNILMSNISLPRNQEQVEVGNACYHSVHNFLCSRLLSKNLKIKIHRTVILPVVLYGCETWSLTLRKERRRRVFENRALRMFGSERDEVTVQ
jgi:hypothetical protein